MPYTPPQEILERYGEVMVNFGLGRTRGIAPGDVVGIHCGEDAKPLLLEVAKAVWRAGGHVIAGFGPADDGSWNLNRAFYEIASPEQLDFFPRAWWKAYFATIDHYLMIGSTRDPHALDGVDSDRIARHNRASGAMLDLRFEKVKAGTLSWTLCHYGTEALATEAGMTLEEYWAQIIHACFLDDPDPVARNRETDAAIQSTVNWLNALEIDSLHIEADDTDLRITLGEGRCWIGGGGANVPSFEIFTSPDWRGTNGHIRFSEPLYRNGTVIEDIHLRFRDGRVVEASAATGEAELGAMLATDEGAAQIGEYSLTDGRHSRITRFMARTLYDENRGGPAGNTHLAVGRAFPEEVYAGELAAPDADAFAALGFNTSSIHVDIISTSERTVTATLKDGSTKVIYRGGQFQLD